VAGLGYAAISAYWAVGGQRLLATVGSDVQRLGHSRGAAVVLGLWAVVVLKAVAAALPAVSLQLPAFGWGRTVAALAWIAAVILTAYGLVLTLVGVMVQAGLIRAGAGADHRALAWHAYLWDPWFLVWGVLATGALICGRVPFPVRLRRAQAGR
jgi:Protein of unknown function (DUF3995)